MVGGAAVVFGVIGLNVASFCPPCLIHSFFYMFSARSISWRKTKMLYLNRRQYLSWRNYLSCLLL
jgi:hypothetical protein